MYGFYETRCIWDDQALGRYKTYKKPQGDSLIFMYSYPIGVLDCPENHNVGMSHCLWFICHGFYDLSVNISKTAQLRLFCVGLYPFLHSESALDISIHSLFLFLNSLYLDSCITLLSSVSSLYTIQVHINCARGKGSHSKLHI